MLDDAEGGRRRLARRDLPVAGQCGADDAGQCAQRRACCDGIGGVGGHQQGWLFPAPQCPLEPFGDLDDEQRPAGLQHFVHLFLALEHEADVEEIGVFERR